jgi:N-acetylmuramoyl-L-alanine amidase
MRHLGRGFFFFCLSIPMAICTLAAHEVLAEPPWLVVIDAGHGGVDPGAVGPNGVREKQINLEIARMIEILAWGDPEIEVVLTRRHDQTLQLRERTDLANRVKAALYVSIHANAHHDPRVQGIETLVADSTEHPMYANSLRLAQAIQQQIMSRLGRVGIANRGVKKQPLYIRWAQMPAVIVESGFISHPTGEKQLQSPSYQMQIAEAVLAGIKAYLKNHS